MHVVGRLGEMTLSELAAEVGVSRDEVSWAVRALVNDGELVTRVHNRCEHVRLTGSVGGPSAAAMLHQAQAAGLAAEVVDYLGRERCRTRSPLVGVHPWHGGWCWLDTSGDITAVKAAA